MTAHKIRVLLGSLGNTADEVADALRARGVTGDAEDPCNCPIANLIKREIPEARNEDLWTYDDSAEDGYFVCKDYVCVDGEGRLTPPPAVARFIELFDDYDPDGVYEDLRLVVWP